MCPSLSPKNWYPTWMGVPHSMLCKDWCQRTGGPNDHKKDMCRLESSGDQIVRSPWGTKGHFVLQVLFLRSTPRAHAWLS